MLMHFALPQPDLKNVAGINQFLKDPWILEGDSNAQEFHYKVSTYILET